MPLKKKSFGEDELLIFDDAIIYQRDGLWQFRMWLPTERKYVRKTLNTRNQTTAIERGKDLYLRLYADMRQGADSEGSRPPIPR